MNGSRGLLILDETDGLDLRSSSVFIELPKEDAFALPHAPSDAVFRVVFRAAKASRRTDQCALDNHAIEISDRREVDAPVFRGLRHDC